jgi:hypothetical protein
LYQIILRSKENRPAGSLRGEEQGEDRFWYRRADKEGTFPLTRFHADPSSLDLHSPMLVSMSCVTKNAIVRPEWDEAAAMYECAGERTSACGLAASFVR